MARSVFISYSHRDEKWRERVLAPLEALSLHTDSLDPWVDTRIEPGADWYQDIVTALDQARAAILLISNNFLRSTFIKEHEVAHLLERRQNEGLPVFAVLVEPCPWTRIDWLVKMQVITYGQGDKSLAELRKPDRQRKLARLAEKIDDNLNMAEARETALPAQAEGPGEDQAGAVSLALKAEQRGDPEPQLYTFYGLTPPSDPPQPATPSVGVSNVLRLWADPSREGNWIRTSLGAEEDLEFFRVRFRTEPGSFPCDVTLRPCGFQPLLNPADKPFLALDLRSTRSDETPDEGFVLGLSVRLVDRSATQWRKGEAFTDAVDLPLDGRWYTVFLDLRRRWTLFASDGNHRYPDAALDPSLIAALVVELGGMGEQRLGAGAARVDLADIRLVDAPPGADPAGRLLRSPQPLEGDRA